MIVVEMMQQYEEYLRKARELLEKAQTVCSHPVEARKTATYRSNDEWDSHAHYRTDHRCLLCQKVWDEHEV